ncbi:Hypothetical_protein [Hexamita inflata]|uniref:Hypothetical_protein n=1 Tax=Hexamita inflata TaxID=28002 RepID=A0AA86TPZ8_9EUKA|nr:Hypothetical protein HINF_LOCUS11655 [Hexamita inflata]
MWYNFLILIVYTYLILNQSVAHTLTSLSCWTKFLNLNVYIAGYFPAQNQKSQYLKTSCKTYIFQFCWKMLSLKCVQYILQQESQQISQILQLPIKLTHINIVLK